MKFDSPATTNPLDRLRVIGHATDRIDGKLKTTGTATYAYEQNEAAPHAAYGYIVGASIAKGRLSAVRVRAARAAPGVLGVVTYENAGKLGTGEFYVDRMLADPAIDHYQQAVALVIAETFEQARHAASLVKVDYHRAPGAFGLAAAKESAVTPKAGAFGPPPRTSTGDFERAYAHADVTLDAIYTTPDQAHAMMEPHATIASWDGDQLTCWSPIQQLNWGVRDLAKILGIAPDNIRIVTPFIGGSFGGKGTILADCVLAALGARLTRRPVKVAMSRPMMFNNTTHRPATIQRLRIGATREGAITAIGHESWSGNLRGGRPEAATTSTHLLYAGANRMTHLRLAVLDLAEGNSMRAPGEASGMMALEIAMDEMAEKLAIDPVRFRILNDTQVAGGMPAYGRRALRLDAAPWRTAPAPRRRMAGRRRHGVRNPRCTRPEISRARAPGPPRHRHRRNRHDRRRYRQLHHRRADRRRDDGCGRRQRHGAPGRFAPAGVARHRRPVGCGLGHGRRVRGLPLFARTGGAPARPRSGHCHLRQRPGAGGNAQGRAGRGGAAGRPGCRGDDGVRRSRPTVCAPDLRRALRRGRRARRLRRMRAVCAAGRILNPKTARSQVIGAMTMGAGAALMEELVVDRRHGFFVNHDLAGYEVPVHADVPHQDVIFLDEVDPFIAPLKAKGVGELGIVGVAAAIANAVYDATGVRVRDYPIRLDDHLDRLPPVA
jgi:xanthine dehydrogenase YagR molybdenum-binding subunit